MKLIALLPFKDEEWILPAYLSSVAPVVDEIVAIDDGSTDRSRALVEAAGGYVVDNTAVVESGWAEHSIRETLLRLGRERGGTHFIGLDADEALTTPSRTHLRAALAGLQPGQKLAMQWLTLWKSPTEYRDDESVWKDLFKDFAFADSGGGGHDYAFLGVARTPGDNDMAKWVRLAPERGAVLHYQFVPWHRTQVKQAWYRCSELIRTPERAYDINQMYSITLETPGVHTRRVPDDWLAGIDVSGDVVNLPPAWHLDAILGWFGEYGVEFFEPLQIWHVPELHERFVRDVGREPVPVTRIGFARRVARAVAARAGRG
jgi:hypothetical protein